MKTQLLLWMVISMLSFNSGAAMAECGQPKAWIELSSDSGKLHVMPYVMASGAYEYKLVSSKHGASGTSSTSQSGTVKAKAGEKTLLSNLQLGFQADDRFSFVLSIYKKKQLIDQFRVDFPDK